MNIPIYDPMPEIKALKPKIDQAIETVLDHGQFILGPEVKAFEEKAAEFLGAKHAVGVNSGTDALVIALRSLGIGEGDEVVTTSMSFFATAESISVVGAKPVFVDIDKETFNINADRIEDAITAKTKAILPVHLYGLPAQMTKIMELAQIHDLKVIEDCAQSFGARYSGCCQHCKGQECDKNICNKIKGKLTGAIGDCGTFSFFPTKNLGGIGDGGLITTNNDEVARRARMLRVHGAEKKYHNEMLGYNSRLDTIQASVLLIKLKYIEKFNANRRKVAELYNQKLEKIDQLKLPSIIEGHIFHQYTVKVKNGDRKSLQNYLKNKGIQTNIYFPVPQNELPVYQNRHRLEASHLASQHILSLPMGPFLSEKVQEKVVLSIENFFR